MSSSCSVTTATTCVGNTATVAWAGCTIDGGRATLSGGWTEVFSAGGCVRPLGNGLSVTRTTTGETLTHANGATRTTDTNGGTAWDGTVIPSSGVTTSRTGVTRTIVINGVHKLKKGPKGTTWFDHFITSTGMTVTGARSTNNRAISGTLTLYHNRAKFTAVNTFNAVTYGDSTCCYPTSGNISSNHTAGSKSGTSTLTFTNTCGDANFVDTDGTASTVTLDQCN